MPEAQPFFSQVAIRDSKEEFETWKHHRVNKKHPVKKAVEKSTAKQHSIHPTMALKPERSRLKLTAAFQPEGCGASQRPEIL